MGGAIKTLEWVCVLLLFFTQHLANYDNNKGNYVINVLRIYSSYFEHNVMN